MIHWGWIIAGFAVGGWFGLLMAALIKKEKGPSVELNRVVSSEDPNTEYLCFPDIRLVFRDGEYAGWYLPGDGKEEEDGDERGNGVTKQDHRCPL